MRPQELKPTESQAQLRCLQRRSQLGWRRATESAGMVASDRVSSLGLRWVARMFRDAAIVDCFEGVGRATVGQADRESGLIALPPAT